MANMQSIVKLLDSKIRLAGMETDNAKRVMELFSKFNLDSGVAVYNWSPEHGFYRLGIEHIFIPKTRMPSEALNYIANSRHYGVYLMSGFADKLEMPSLQKILTKISTQEVENEKLAVFIDDNIQVPEALASYMAKINYRPGAEQRKTA